MIKHEGKQNQPVTGMNWARIPDGTKIRHSLEGYEGVIDGLTETVTGSRHNPDGRTHYRVNVGAFKPKLAVEEDLLILTDQDGLVVMPKQQVEFRRSTTERLRGIFTAERFLATH